MVLATIAKDSRQRQSGRKYLIQLNLQPVEPASWTCGPVDLWKIFEKKSAKHG